MTVQVRPFSQHCLSDLGGTRSSRNRSRLRTGGIERSMRLSAEQKCSIAKAEIENLGQEIIAFRKNAESMLDDYQVLFISKSTSFTGSL